MDGHRARELERRDPVTRLDVALVEAGRARSRTHARRIIEEGRARIDGAPATKPSTPVRADARLDVVDVPDGLEYASRAAHKLAGALDRLDVDPAGLRCLDAGASTGGFTDVLLRRGAAHVDAVDIGTGQLAAHVAADPRVAVHDGTSIRGLLPGDVSGPAQLIVADLSFISLRTVMGDLAGLAAPGARLLLMVKPQFEVGREHLPRGGVVRDPAQQRDAVLDVARGAARQGLVLEGVGASELPGQDGNREFFVLLVRAPGAVASDATTSDAPPGAYDMIDQAMREVARGNGPSAAGDASTREGHSS